MNQPALSHWNPYPTSKPTEYGKYFVCRKDGKVHWETWNNTGWAYNNNTIVCWATIIEPDLKLFVCYKE